MKHTSRSLKNGLNIWALSGEIGLKLAIPVTICVLVGIKLDKTFATLPLFTIAGIVLSFIVSGILIARMIHHIQDLEREQEE